MAESLRILVINPNSSKDMTRGMEGAITTMNLPPSVEWKTYTASQDSPASIDDDKTLADSTNAVCTAYVAKGELSLDDHDAVLIACFSVHPLTSRLYELAARPGLAIMGIFEASILTALSLLPPPPSRATWGIVTTGKFWEKHLSDGVAQFLGQESGATNARFAGVYSTGLTAGDFHHVSPEDVRKRLVATTTELLQAGDVNVVVMGCAGMAGLENIIRTTAVEVYGQERGQHIYVVDGVKSGMLQLEQSLRNRRAASSE